MQSELVSVMFNSQGKKIISVISLNQAKKKKKKKKKKKPVYKSYKLTNRLMKQKSWSQIKVLSDCVDGKAIRCDI
jgi:hypothetical protein